MCNKVIKCSHCNIIINELLSFIQNKVEVIDEATLISICAKTFSEEEIYKAKSLLYDSLLGEKLQYSRKKNDMGQRDLEETISIFKQYDSKKLPVFVARNLENLPPILWNQLDVTALLKSLVRLQSDVDSIKNNLVTTDQLREVQTDIENLKLTSLVNCDYAAKNSNRRAAFLTTTLDSGPAGLADLSVSQDTIKEYRSIDLSYSTVAAAAAVPISTAFHQGMDTSAESHLPPPAMLSQHSVAPVPQRPSASNTTSVSARAARVANRTNAIKTATVKVPRVSAEESNKNTATSKQTPADADNNWTVVSRKRKSSQRKVVRGSGVASDLLCAADRIKYLHLWGARSDMTERNVIDYLNKKKQSNLYTAEKLVTKRSQGYASFKIGVPEASLEQCLSSEFWPTGFAADRWLFRLERSNTEKEKQIERKA